MYNYQAITNDLLDSLVDDIENTIEEVLYNIGEHKESNDAFIKEAVETRNEILYSIVHRINTKYLNKYTKF